MRNVKGQFEKGTHWRERKPWWEKSWLDYMYSECMRSASDIASAFGTTENNILYWLSKHGIKRRTVKQARALKHWGVSGECNPMHGRTGILNPNWKGGLTPARQAIYAKSEMKQAVQAVYKRDRYCRLCNAKDPLEVHHIDPFSQSPLLVMDIGNMIVLCSKCHRKMRGKEKLWKRRLFKIISEKGG
jgi:hypothetical protein